MVRKTISAIIVMVLFCTLVLNAAAAPIAKQPMTNLYTKGDGPTAKAEPEAVPALAGAFLLGVAASLVANAAYDYAKHQNWIWGSAEQAMDTRAEVVFDY